MSRRATLRRGLLALATGLAAFLVVGVAVYLRERADRFAPASVRSSR